MKQYRNEMAIIVHRQRIFHCLNNGCVSSWARVLEKYQQAIESDSQFFIASIKTDPFSILITSRIFYSFFFSTTSTSSSSFLCSSFPTAMFVCVHCSRAQCSLGLNRKISYVFTITVGYCRFSRFYIF